MTDHQLAVITDADQNPCAVYLGKLKPTGKRAQLGALQIIAGLLGGQDPFTIQWASLRFQHTATIRAKLIEVYKPATCNRILSALRGVLKSAWQLGQMTSEDYYRAIEIENVTGSTLPAGRELSQGELTALMDDCASDATPAGVRDGAIIGLMYSCGLRRDEVVNLNFADYEPSTGELKLTGKRSKERMVYLVNGAQLAMDDWLAIRGNEAGALFWAINKSGHMINRKLSNQAIYYILSQRAQSARVANFSPHDLRRTFVSDLLDAGADISTVAKLAGHASVNTTARYDRRPEEAKRKAVQLLRIAYSKRK